MPYFNPRDTPHNWSPSDSRHEDLLRGCVGLWAPCTGPTGATLFDRSGFKWNGTLTNMDPPTDWVVNRAGYALDFDNTNDFVELAGIPRLVLTDSPGFWLAGWFIPQVINNQWHTLFTKINSNNTNRQIFLAVNGNFSTPVNGLSFFTNRLGDGGVGTTALTAGRLYFFCAMHYSATSGNELWIWSREAGWLKGTSGLAASATGIDADAGTNPVRIGRFTDASPLPLGGQVLEMIMGLDGRNAPYRQLQAIGPGGIFEPRRRLFGYSQAAGFRPVWARRHSQVIGGGTL